MPAKSTKLGPGTLVLGEIGTPQDASCQVVGAEVGWDVDAEDPITTLCGDAVGGGRTYSATLSGSFLQDLDDDAGLVAYTWTNKGVDVPFVFVPNTAAKATVTGKLTIDPLNVGSTDDHGATMQSDFEWGCVGEPSLTWEAEPPAPNGDGGQAVVDEDLVGADA